MRLRYIGADGWNGLIKGELYDVCIRSVMGNIWIDAYSANAHVLSYPYGRLRRLLDDWEDRNVINVGDPYMDDNRKYSGLLADD